MTDPTEILLYQKYLYWKQGIPTFQYRKEYDRAMSPIIGMYEKGTFAQTYKTRNAKTVKIMGETELILPNVRDMMDEGLQLIQMEALDMPNKNLSRYLDEEMLSGDLSMFTCTNINDKIRCFCSRINIVKKALVCHSDSIEKMMEQANFEDMTELDQIKALGILARDGEDVMARYIARTVTLNADLLY